MSKAIAVAKPSIESVGAESHQPSPHATKSRKQKLIDAPRQSNTSVKALANEAVTVNDHPTRPPRLILIVAPVSSRLSRDTRIRFRESRHQESNFPLRVSKRTQMRILFRGARRFANTRTGSLWSDSMKPI